VKGRKYKNLIQHLLSKIAVFVSVFREILNQKMPSTVIYSIPWEKFHPKLAEHALNSNQHIPVKVYQPTSNQCWV